MAVALHHLGGRGLEADLELLADRLLHFRREMGEGSDRSRDLADAGTRQGISETLLVAAHLLEVDEQLQTEGRGLGVDAVSPPDARSVFELDGPSA